MANNNLKLPTLNKIREFGWILCIRDLYKKHKTLTENINTLVTMTDDSMDDLLSQESIDMINEYGGKLKNMSTYSHIHHQGDNTLHTPKETFTATATGVKFNFVCKNPSSNGPGTNYKIDIPTASSTQAGIITADDYKKLNTITEIPTVTDGIYLITYLLSVVLNAEGLFTAEGGQLMLKTPFLIDSSIDIYDLMLNDNCSYINFLFHNDILTFEMIDENTFGLTYNSISYVCDSCGSASPDLGIVFNFTVSG